jgi:hypothetical protein
VRGPPSCASHVGWNRYRARMLGWIAESVDLEPLRFVHLRPQGASECVGLASLRAAPAMPLLAWRPRATSMNLQRLNILYVSQMPVSPPRFGRRAAL